MLHAAHYTLTITNEYVNKNIPSISDLARNVRKIALPILALYILSDVQKVDAGPVSYAACVLACEAAAVGATVATAGAAAPAVAACIQACAAFFFAPFP